MKVSLTFAQKRPKAQILRSDLYTQEAKARLQQTSKNCIGKMKILLLEDNMAHVGMIESMLEDSLIAPSWEVIDIPQVTDVPGILQYTTFDVALINLSLLDKACQLIVAAMKMAPETMPVIIYTGHQDHSPMRMAVVNGMYRPLNMHIQPPSQLVLALHNALSDAITY